MNKICITIDSAACKGCGICIDNCKGSVLEFSKKRNTKGYLYPESVNINDCVFCLNCELLCPDMAIEVKKEEK